MVGNITLFYIHQRLKGIFCDSSSDLFPSISIIPVEDLYQLPQIKKGCNFCGVQNCCSQSLSSMDAAFKMIELTEIKRQEGEKAFTGLLYRIRTGSRTDDDLKVLQ